MTSKPRPVDTMDPGRTRDHLMKALTHLLLRVIAPHFLLVRLLGGDIGVMAAPPPIGTHLTLAEPFTLLPEEAGAARDSSGVALAGLPPGPYAKMNALIENFKPGLDADKDGYYETFDFDIGINAHGYSALLFGVPLPISVWPKIICNTTGQAWWSAEAWTINGLNVYHLTIYHWNQDSFKGLIKTNTALDFTVELWTNTKATRLDQAAVVKGEPIKADITPAVRIASILPAEVTTNDWGDTVTWTITGVDAEGKPARGAFLGGDDTLIQKPVAARTDATGQIPYTTYVPKGRANGAYAVRFTLALNGSPPSEPETREVIVNHRVTVLGRVIDGDTTMPLEGVRVSAGAGSADITSADGTFELHDVPSASDRHITATKEAYGECDNHPLRFPPGEDPVRLPDDIRLYLKATNIVVRSVVPRLDGLFLAGVPLENEFTAQVDWAGHPPGTVEFALNDRLLGTVPTASAGTMLRSEIGSLLKPSIFPSANRIQVWAIDAAGRRSPSFELSILATEVHPLIRRILEGSLSVLKVAGPSTYATEIQCPNLPLRQAQRLPILKSFDTSISAHLKFSYDWTERRWRIETGATTSLNRKKFGKWIFSMAENEIIGALGVEAQGVATADGGMEVPPMIGVALSLDGEASIFLYISEAFGNVWSRSIDAMLQSTGMDLDAYSFDRVRLRAGAGIGGNAAWQLGGSLVPAGGNVNIHIGAGLSYEPKLLDWLDMKAHLTGSLEGNLEFRPQLAIVSSGAFTGGVEFHVMGIAMLSYSGVWPINTGRGSALNHARTTGFAHGAPSPKLETIDRRYLDHGPERFVAAGQGAEGLPERPRKMTHELGVFSVLGEPRVRRARSAPLQGGAVNVPPQIDLVLSENITTESHPVIAARGTELMLVYVADNGGANPLQFTDLRWTRWDGSRWTTPELLTHDTRAEYSPQIAFDGNGDAIAVWVRVADSAFSQLDLVALAAELEIVWARWDRATGEWSDPVALTNDRKLDHQPRLSGPLSDGSLLLVWTHNDHNRLLGAGSPGDPENDQVWWSRWSPADGKWSPPGVLVSNLTHRLSQSLAARDARGVYAWTAEIDGDLTAGADQALHYREWTNGVWQEVRPVDFATNNAARVRATVSANGDINLLWTQESNLVRQVNFAGSPSLVRSEGDGLGFADYEVTAGPTGELVVLWQDVTAQGPDAHFRVYDPAAGSWSEDLRLSHDSSLERSFSPVWDAAGNLTVAYCKVEMLRTNHTIADPDGVPATITNFPTPGRVDLVVTKRALARDVALLPGDFTTEGNSFLPGQPLNLIALVRNLGARAVSNVVVRFYDGDPGAGGTRIRDSVLFDWLPAGGTATVTNAWLLPAPATPHQLFAVVDPEHQIGEWPGLETNNVQSVALGGTDLAVVGTKAEVSTNGAVHFDITVRNFGGPASVACQLSVRPDSATNAPLGVAKVPALEPGTSARISVDAPAGMQPEGDRIYSIAVDEEALSHDKNLTNNRTELVVSRWVDGDRDGMPDSWELAHGLIAESPADATLDPDGDGRTNLEEFYSGTDPQDASSYPHLRPGLSAMPDVVSGIRLLWSSVGSRVYTLERTESLGTPFAPISEHIPATPPENEYLDLSATNRNDYFYRLKTE